ncbi:MAG: glutamate racemase [bacterium]|nr:glutamate racemase [bacterium]
MKIGVFDSGIGGLTVLKSLISKYKANYIYFGDTLNIPYGEKSKEELLKLTEKIIRFFEKEKVDLIIVACGTVSSNIYDELSKKTNIKMINIVYNIIDLIKKDNPSNIAVIATKKTIDSHIFKNNINNIIEISCPKIVPYIEKNIGNINDILKEYLSFIKEKHINNIVLGCTHYPLIKEDIQKYLDYEVKFYDMGKILLENIKESNLKIEMYFSYLDENLIKNINNIIKEDKSIDKLIL